MKYTTEYDVRALINEATSNLRADVMRMLASRNRADQLRRDNDQFNKCNDKAVEDRPEPNKPEPTPPAIRPYPATPELAAAFDQGYDAAKKAAADRAEAAAIRNSGSGEYARGYAAAVLRHSYDTAAATMRPGTVEAAPTPLYRTNEELNFAAGVRQGRKEGHSSAIDAVLVLIRNAPSYTPNATLAAAVRKLEP